MTIKDIKPIPKYIEALIRRKDTLTQDGRTRYYKYLAIWHKELVQITVAVRNKQEKWYCKQVAVHGLYTNIAFSKDINLVMCGGYITSWYSEHLTRNKPCYKPGVWYESDDKYYHLLFAPIVNAQEIYAKIKTYPQFKYSAIELYNGDNPIEYLRKYQQYPQLEMLSKLGLSHLMSSDSILKKMKQDKHFCKWIYKNVADLKKTSANEITAILRAYKQNTTLAYELHRQRCEKVLRKESNTNWIAVFHNDYTKLFAYLAKQNISIYTYKDYLTACIALNLDTTLARTLFPHDFYYWHDTRIEQYRHQQDLENEQKQKALLAQFKSAIEKYCLLNLDTNKTFLCRIATHPNELKQEGDILGHCVGRMTYDKKMAQENTLIFFLRKQEAPDTPYVTIELSIKEQRILQCYASHNSRPEQDALDFATHTWLPHAQKQLHKIKKAQQCA